jgi:hypothetical protein
MMTQTMKKTYEMKRISKSRGMSSLDGEFDGESIQMIPVGSLYSNIEKSYS